MLNRTANRLLTVLLCLVIAQVTVQWFYKAISCFGYKKHDTNCRELAPFTNPFAPYFEHGSCSKYGANRFAKGASPRNLCYALLQKPHFIALTLCTIPPYAMPGRIFILLFIQKCYLTPRKILIWVIHR